MNKTKRFKKFYTICFRGFIVLVPLCHMAKYAGRSQHTKFACKFWHKGVICSDYFADFDSSHKDIDLQGHCCLKTILQE